MPRISTKSAIEMIAEKSGMSVEMVRRVQKAETDYIIEMLSNGYKAQLPGRGTFDSVIRKKFLVGGIFEDYIKPTFTVSAVIRNALEEIDDYKDGIENDIDDLSDIEGVLLSQIPDLQ